MARVQIGSDFQGLLTTQERGTVHLVHNFSGLYLEVRNGDTFTRITLDKDEHRRIVSEGNEHFARIARGDGYKAEAVRLSGEGCTSVGS